MAIINHHQKWHRNIENNFVNEFRKYPIEIVHPFAKWCSIVLLIEIQNPYFPVEGLIFIDFFSQLNCNIMDSAADLFINEQTKC